MSVSIRAALLLSCGLGGPGAPLGAADVIPAGREEQVLALFAPYGLGAEVEPGVVLQDVRIEQRTIHVVLRRGGETVATLVLGPRLPGDAAASTSFSFSGADDVPGARRVLVEAVRRNDVGGIYLAAKVAPRRRPAAPTRDELRHQPAALGWGAVLLLLGCAALLWRSGRGAPALSPGAAPWWPMALALAGWFTLVWLAPAPLHNDTLGDYLLARQRLAGVAGVHTTSIRSLTHGESLPALLALLLGLGAEPGGVQALLLAAACAAVIPLERTAALVSSRAAPWVAAAAIPTIAWVAELPVQWNPLLPPLPLALATLGLARLGAGGGGHAVLLVGAAIVLGAEGHVLVWALLPAAAGVVAALAPRRWHAAALVGAAVSAAWILQPDNCLAAWDRGPLALVGLVPSALGLALRRHMPSASPRRAAWAVFAAAAGMALLVVAAALHGRISLFPRYFGPMYPAALLLAGAAVAAAMTAARRWAAAVALVGAGLVATGWAAMVNEVGSPRSYGIGRDAPLTLQDGWGIAHILGGLGYGYPDVLLRLGSERKAELLGAFLAAGEPLAPAPAPPPPVRLVWVPREDPRSPPAGWRQWPLESGGRLWLSQAPLWLQPIGSRLTVRDAVTGEVRLDTVLDAATAAALGQPPLLLAQQPAVCTPELDELAAGHLGPIEARYRVPLAPTAAGPRVFYLAAAPGEAWRIAGAEGVELRRLDDRTVELRGTEGVAAALLIEQQLSDVPALLPPLLELGPEELEVLRGYRAL